METRTISLLDLPTEILNEMVKPDNLDTKSLINLSSVNKYARSRLFKPALLLHLNKHIKRSEKKQVEGLLKIYPSLDATHLRDICQKVLREKDIDLFKILTKGRKDVLMKIESPKKTDTYDFSAVVSAIESAKNVEEALAKMRTDLDQIAKEKGFPFQAMLHAYKIYDKEFSSWTGEQCQLFSVKVIGYLQRLSPAWFKKALATGIYDITERSAACGDSFILQSGESIDPADIIPNKGLGFDFCVNITGSSQYMLVMSGADIKTFEKLFSAKIAELDELIQRPQNRKNGPRCVIS